MMMMIEDPQQNQAQFKQTLFLSLSLSPHQIQFIRLSEIFEKNDLGRFLKETFLVLLYIGLKSQKEKITTIYFLFVFFDNNFFDNNYYNPKTFKIPSLFLKIV